MICSRKGYKLKVVMPDNVTPERTQLLRMYGAEIVYSPGNLGSNGAVELALKMASEDSSYYMPYQYGNAANPRAHYNGTGVEILEELDNDVAAFVAGLGTGGTLMGVGRRLREELGDAVKIIATSTCRSRMMHSSRGCMRQSASRCPSCPRLRRARRSRTAVRADSSTTGSKPIARSAR
jgi:cysteine synthase B